MEENKNRKLGTRYAVALGLCSPKGNWEVHLNDSQKSIIECTNRFHEINTSLMKLGFQESFLKDLYKQSQILAKQSSSSLLEVFEAKFQRAKDLYKRGIPPYHIKAKDL